MLLFTLLHLLSSLLSSSSSRLFPPLSLSHTPSIFIFPTNHHSAFSRRSSLAVAVEERSLPNEVADGSILQSETEWSYSEIH